MSFPSSNLSVPSSITLPYQFSFNGALFGPSTAYEYTKIEGLDRADPRTGDVDRPRQRGQFIGLDLTTGRDITLTGEIGTDGVSLQHATAAYRNALSSSVVNGTTEYPLWFLMPSGYYVVMARARKDNIPIDVAYSQGSLAQNVIVAFHATDPNIYGAPTQTVTVALPTPGVGLSFPLSFPLSFGVAGGGNSAVCTNSGNVECYPIFTITGPCTNPTIINETSGQALQFIVSMNTGDTLVINTDSPHTATYTNYGSGSSSSVLYLLNPVSSWFSLAPALGPNAVPGGMNTIEFQSSDPLAVAGTLNIQYASAYSSVA